MKQAGVHLQKPGPPYPSSPPAHLPIRSCDVFRFPSQRLSLVGAGQGDRLGPGVRSKCCLNVPAGRSVSPGV